MRSRRCGGAGAAVVAVVEVVDVDDAVVEDDPPPEGAVTFDPAGTVMGCPVVTSTAVKVLITVVDFSITTRVFVLKPGQVGPWYLVTESFGGSNGLPQ